MTLSCSCSRGCPPRWPSGYCGSSDSLLGQRKHVTILFADVRGLTALVDSLHPEHALAIIAPVIKVLMEAVHQNDGFVNQTRGDGIMADVLQRPSPTRSMRSGPATRRSLCARASTLIDARPECLIEIRIGLNSGEVVIHSIGNDLGMQFDAAGKTTHLAARMEQVAEPGAILLTAATFEQAKGFVDARFKGKQTLRGIHDPVELFELRSALFRTRWQVRAERGLSALMGRTTEWAFLKGTYDRAADHRGTLISVVGAPGVGKSRLVHDFIRLTVGGDWVVLEAACASQRMTSSYDAISMLVRAWFKIASGDTPEAVVQRVDAKIAEIDASLLPYVPAILSLLDVKSEEPNWQTLDPVQRRQKMGEAVRALILAQARASPRRILVEDVHWADTETMLVLDRLAATLC